MTYILVIIMLKQPISLYFKAKNSEDIFFQLFIIQIYMMFYP